MITCGYKNGDPEAITTPESGSVCRFSAQNGLWGMRKSGGDPSCTLAGRCRDHHDCLGGCGKTENTKFLATTCSNGYLLHDTQVPLLTKPGTDTLTAETSEPSSGTTDETTPPETASETAAEASDDNGHQQSSNVGAIVGGVVGGLAIICGTAISALYLLRRNREHTPEGEKETTETARPASAQNCPRELAGSNPIELQGDSNLNPPQLPPVELS
ncbi:syndecan domain-containing [Fusarium longipes]|uniref:Syndecan domain-containing n=1 Tax=Fusarium longipes TaxID=694270 RepID=A0A395SFM0_9HYPO|nr:syndecan domain-containing [Fusarium longipes]